MFKFLHQCFLDSWRILTLTIMEVPSSSGSPVSQQSCVSSLGTSSWSHMCAFTKGSHTTGLIEIPCPTKHPSNLMPAILAYFGSASSSCSTDSQCFYPSHGTSTISLQITSACSYFWSSISFGRSWSVLGSCTWKIWTCWPAAGNWHRASFNIIVSSISDDIHTVEQEESAKYVEPKGLVAKAWDLFSK